MQVRDACISSSPHTLSKRLNALASFRPRAPSPDLQQTMALARSAIILALATWAAADWEDKDPTAAPISAPVATPVATPVPTPVEGLRKILCLHGGGGSAASMAAATAEMAAALSGEYTFVAASIWSDPNQDELWWADPPGGKGEPTTDPDHASAMVAALDAIVASQGPFYGILGYSQGSAAVPVYLSQVAMGTFQMAVMFCGYLTDTHTGLLNRVNAASPFGGIRALVFMGQQDTVISNAQTTAQAGVFTSPTVVSSINTGHSLPASTDPTFSDVLAFFRATDTPTPAPTGVATAATTGVTTVAPTAAPTVASTACHLAPATCVVPSSAMGYKCVCRYVVDFYDGAVAQYECQPDNASYFEETWRRLNDVGFPYGINETVVFLPCANETAEEYYVTYGQIFEWLNDTFFAEETVPIVQRACAVVGSKCPHKDVADHRNDSDFYLHWNLDVALDPALHFLASRTDHSTSTLSLAVALGCSTWCSSAYWLMTLGSTAVLTCC